MISPGSSSTRSRRWPFTESGMCCRLRPAGHRVGGGVGGGQCDCKGAAPTWACRHGHAAAVRSDDLLYQGEAEAIAVDLSRDRVRAAVEQVEDVRKVFTGNPGPVIFDGDAHFLAPPFGRPLRTDAHPAVTRAVLHRVADQVL